MEVGGEEESFESRRNCFYTRGGRTSYLRVCSDAVMLLSQSYHRSAQPVQELCESQGGHPGLSVLMHGSATLNHA